jgi:hypothetical protein
MEAAFLASEMCELESLSESLAGNLLEGKGIGRLNCLLPSSFLHSVVFLLGSAIKVSCQKRWRLLYLKITPRPLPSTSFPINR